MLTHLIREIRAFRELNPQTSNDFVRWLSGRQLIENWDKRDVYQACLGRLPDLALGVLDWTYKSREECAAHIAACLTCAEFRVNAVDIIGRAMPSMPRIFFIHIPRTAGTSVQATLEVSSGALVWHESFENADWFKRAAARKGLDELGFSLHFLSQFADAGARLTVAGHTPLSVLLSRRLIRSIDKVFTVIRSPEEIIFSNLAYMIDIARSGADDPDAIDWRSWFSSLGCGFLAGAMPTPEDARLILQSARFASEYARPLARYLSISGRGDDVAEALNLVRCDVLDIETIGDYLSELYGSRAELKPINESRTPITELVGSAERDFVQRELSGPDMDLWRCLARVTEGQERLLRAA